MIYIIGIKFYQDIELKKYNQDVFDPSNYKFLDDEDDYLHLIHFFVRIQDSLKANKDIQACFKKLFRSIDEIALDKEKIRIFMNKTHRNVTRHEKNYLSLEETRDDKKVTHKKGKEKKKDDDELSNTESDDNKSSFGEAKSILAEEYDNEHSTMDVGQQMLNKKGKEKKKDDDELSNTESDDNKSSFGEAKSILAEEYDNKHSTMDVGQQILTNVLDQSTIFLNYSSTIEQFAKNAWKKRQPPSKKKLVSQDKFYRSHYREKYGDV